MANKDGKSASEESLEELHKTLADTLAAAVKAEGANASILNVARQFLKDNNIQAVPAVGTPLAKLKSAVDALPFEGADEFNSYSNQSTH